MLEGDRDEGSLVPIWNMAANVRPITIIPNATPENIHSSSGEILVVELPSLEVKVLSVEGLTTASNINMAMKIPELDRIVNAYLIEFNSTLILSLQVRLGMRER
jgi:hypothetical protein